MSERRTKGFTLIEMVTVIGITAFLSTIGLLSFRNVQRNMELDNTAEDVVNTLRVAQNRAMTAQDGSDHGVYIENDRFTLYRGNDFATSPPDGRVVTELATGLSITVAGGALDVSFERLNGVVPSTEDIVIETSPSNQRTIRIERIGGITLR